jgi:predicted NBD/HSP70 family sugar kinase
LNAIGVDVGGTKIAAGVVTPEGEILNEVRYPSSGPRERLLSSITRAVIEVKDGYEVGAVCLAVPGFVMGAENKVIFAPNLHAIEGVPLKDELGERTGLSVTVENDANAAAWGEFRFGAGREVDHLVFITLGTGVGGGVVMHGILLRGAQGAGPAAVAATTAAWRHSRRGQRSNVAPARSRTNNRTPRWDGSPSSVGCWARMLRSSPKKETKLPSRSSKRPVCGSASGSPVSSTSSIRR